MSEELSSTQQQKHIATSKEKLDAIFGITGGKTVDDFLNDIGLDAQKIQTAMSEMDDTVKEEVQKIDNAQNLLEDSKDGNLQLVEMNSLDKSMKKLEEMIFLSSSILQHVAENIMASDLIDSELLAAYSKLMESIHIGQQEFISIYKEKLSFVNKIKMSMIQHQQKKDLMLYKHQLTLELLERKQKQDGSVVDPENISTSNWDQDRIIKILDSNEKEQ